jgi:hypothetical protein
MAGASTPPCNPHHGPINDHVTVASQASAPQVASERLRKSSFGGHDPAKIPGRRAESGVLFRFAKRKGHFHTDDMHAPV